MSRLQVHITSELWVSSELLIWWYFHHCHLKCRWHMTLKPRGAPSPIIHSPTSNKAINASCPSLSVSRIDRSRPDYGGLSCPQTACSHPVHHRIMLPLDNAGSWLWLSQAHNCRDRGKPPETYTKSPPTVHLRINHCFENARPQNWPLWMLSLLLPCTTWKQGPWALSLQRHLCLLVLDWNSAPRLGSMVGCFYVSSTARLLPPGPLSHPADSWVTSKGSR